MTFNPPLILASNSPRRREILEMLELEFEQESSPFEEPVFDFEGGDPQEFIEEVAYNKGFFLFRTIEESCQVLSADTIGLIDGKVLEKPTDKEHAKQMLQQLSGKTHQVLTSVCLFHSEKELRQKTVTTDVTFRELSPEEIDWYLSKNTYQDKAAAYAIQEHASVFVEKVEGDYFNIVGLPIKTIWQWFLDDGLLKKSQ